MNKESKIKELEEHVQKLTDILRQVIDVAHSIDGNEQWPDFTLLNDAIDICDYYENNKKE